MVEEMLIQQLKALAEYRFNQQGQRKTPKGVRATVSGSNNLKYSQAGTKNQGMLALLHIHLPNNTQSYQPTVFFHWPVRLMQPKSIKTLQAQAKALLK